MTDAEILEYAQSALTTLEQGNVKGACNDLRNLLAGLIQAKTALEANPPLEAPVLAEVEGWFSEEPVYSKLIILAPWKVSARYDSFEAFGATRVTITIRKRDVQAR